MDNHEKNSSEFIETLKTFKNKYFKHFDVFNGKIYEADIARLESQKYDMVISLGK